MRKWIGDAIALVAMLGFLTAIFAGGVYGQVLAVYFGSERGGNMLAPMAALGCVGYIWARQKEFRFCLFVITGALLIMINQRGFYWHVFERGEGFFTLNRVTAHAIFALCLIGPAVWKKYVSKD